MTVVAALVADNLAIWTGAIERRSAAGRGGGKRINLHGIERLRGLILDLAVQGKLVRQQENDEPASLALRRVAKARQQKIEAGKARKPRALQALPDDLAALPAGWEWTQLGIIAEISPGNDAADDIDVSFVPMTLISTSIDGSHDSEIRKWGEVKKGFTQFAEGDIGLAKITPCFENGKAAIFRNLSSGIGAGTTELHVARPWSDDVDRRYLLLTMKTSSYLRVGEAGMTGTAGKKRLTRAHFECHPLPLPPLAEQHRIVAKVDELMALCDSLEEESAAALEAHQRLVESLLATLVDSPDAPTLATNWSRLEPHFNILFTTDSSVGSLRQAILELAVRGKLVVQNANDGIALQIDRAPIDPSSLPFEVPSNWRWARLSSLGSLTGGGTPAMGRSDFWDGSIPWVSPKDMKTDYINQAQMNITDAAVAGSSVKMIEAESILFVVRGMILAHSFPVAVARVGLTINQDMKALTLNSSEMTEYVLRALKGLKPLMLARIQRSSHGTCRIDSSDLNNFLIPIPPLAEQHRIVAKVDGLMALCDALKAGLAEAADTQRHLADAIVEKAAA